MYLGKIVEIGSAEDVFRHPVHPYTKALLEAVPVPDPETEDKERGILQGEIGSSEAPPAGCRFHTRCPYAVEACGKEEPAMMKAATGAADGHHKAGGECFAAERADYSAESGHYAACPRIMDK